MYTYNVKIYSVNCDLPTPEYKTRMALILHGAIFINSEEMSSEQMYFARDLLVLSGTNRGVILFIACMPTVLYMPSKSHHGNVLSVL